MCKLLYTHTLSLDIIALQVKITDFVAAALNFVDNFECELVGSSLHSLALLQLNDLHTRTQAILKQQLDILGMSYCSCTLQ